MSKYVDLYIAPKSIEAYKVNSEKNFLLDRSLKVDVVEHGLILPSKEDTRSIGKKLWAIGGVLDMAGDFVTLSELGSLWGGKYDYGSDEELLIDEDVLFMGPFIAHLGHFICDEISRLW